MSDTPTLIHRTDINAQSYDLNGVLVDVRLTKLSDGRWRVDEIVAAGTDDEVCACIRTGRLRATGGTAGSHGAGDGRLAEARRVAGVLADALTGLLNADEAAAAGNLDLLVGAFDDARSALAVFDAMNEGRAAATPDPDVRDGDWRCLCGDLNREHEACCFRCGGGDPREEMPDLFFTDQQERALARREGYDEGVAATPRDDALAAQSAADAWRKGYAAATAEAAASPDERLREALAFYADKSNYTAQNPVGSGAHVWRDMGQRARAALAADRDSLAEKPETDT